eukprot:1155105-Pelagomonas_calceolata.AAC.7
MWVWRLGNIPNTAQSTPPNYTPSTGTRNSPPQLANKEISNLSWSNPSITLKHQINTLKYCKRAIPSQKHAISSSYQIP